jgi:hypothetical protein
VEFPTSDHTQLTHAEICWVERGRVRTDGKTHVTTCIVTDVVDTYIEGIQTIRNDGNKVHPVRIPRDLIEAAYWLGGVNDGTPIVWPDGKLAREEELPCCSDT